MIRAHYHPVVRMRMVCLSGMTGHGVTLRIFFLVSLLIHAAAVYSWERYGPAKSIGKEEMKELTLKVTILSGGDLPFQDNVTGSGEQESVSDETEKDGRERAGEEDELHDGPGEHTVQKEENRVVLKPPDTSPTVIDRISPRLEPLSDRFMERLVSDFAPQRDERALEEIRASIDSKEGGSHRTAAQYSLAPLTREVPPRGSIISTEILSSGGINSLSRIEFSGSAWLGNRYVNIVKHGVGGVYGGKSREGADREARLLRIEKPAYPYYDRRREHEGEVLLEAYVLADGRVGAVEVVKSSKHRGLDSVAVKALRKARFRPAVRGAMPVPSHVKISFKFLLEDER